MPNLQFELITPEGAVYSGPVTAVRAPGSEGSFSVLDRHADFLTTLGEGLLKITLADQSIQSWQVAGGVLEVYDNTVAAMVETAKPAA